MKKLMLFAVLCLFMFGSATVSMAQDPVKTATEQKEEKKDADKKETENKVDNSKEAEEAQKEKTPEKTSTDKKADEPAK